MKTKEQLAEEYAGIHYRNDAKELFGNIVQDFIAGFDAGAKQGRQDALRECLEIIKSVRSRYPIDIFPQFKDATEENVSVDRISAQMARHLCNKLLIDFQTLMQQESGNE